MTAGVLELRVGEVGDAAVEELRAHLRGRLITPNDADYDEARQLWNGMIDRRPALIARCAGAADVIACVNFARDNQVLVSVRGGGHNLPGISVCDGGLVIDLSDMKGIRVDPGRRVARAEPGLRWGEFDRETHAFGLATTGGTNTDTGIAGLSLGGGIGWLGGKYGLVVDNVLSVDIVGADGQLRTASATENPDLFWAVRGGGGNFGVVTSFEYRLHPVSTVFGGLIAYPLSEARQVLRSYREFVGSAPDELGTLAVLMSLPDGSPAAGIACCFNGPLEQGEAVTAPLSRLGSPVMTQVAPMPYPALQGMADDLLPAGRQYYAKAPFLKELNDDVIDAVVAHYEKRPSPVSLVLVQQKGGAMSRGGEDSAFGQRAAPFNLVVIAAWDDPSIADHGIAWARALADAVEPHTTGGSYFNDLGRPEDDGAGPVRAAFGAERYERLVEVKTKYDPQNLFRHNQNIPPRNGAGSR